MTAEYELLPSDYRAFRRHVFFRLRKMHYIYILCVALFSWLTWTGGKNDPLSTRIGSVLMLWVMFAAVVLALTAFMTLIHKFRRARFTPTLGRHVLEVREDALEETNPSGRTELKLAALQRIDETKAHFFVITRHGTGIIIPKRALLNPEELRALRARICAVQ